MGLKAPAGMVMIERATGKMVGPSVPFKRDEFVYKILLIHHRQLGQWLPLGGHIEPDEDPGQAALREAKEESGLDVKLLGERPPTAGPGARALIAPRFLDIHRINPAHEHIGMMYWARPGDVARASRPSDSETHGQDARATLAAAEHYDIRWCSAADWDTLQPPMAEAVKRYCRAAIREISSLA